MNIFLTGDTHGNISRIKRFCKSEKNSLLIILGDFGFLWDGLSDKNLDKISGVAIKNNNTIAFIDGNHENFERLNSYKTDIWNGGNVSFLRNNIIHLHRGQIFFIEKNIFFTMGGARSVDKNKRSAFISWWPQEDISYMDMDMAYKNLSDINFKVDYVLTHTLPRTFKQYFGVVDYKSDSNETSLDYIFNKIEFKSWFFGHYHIDKSTIINNHTVRCLYHDIIKLDTVDKAVPNVL